ncbi:neuroendocrine convertase 1-like isoform X1 [Temnothorax curvispinosus]|uniref:Neuroendocrine convertase 1-like isoform X1 n=2 Tax=Temnothorax curvispinosus TaxID=300111 RepID=A0A6J1QAZ0_9HYME|nr:neuroendocrine convertase 1-like isoform X1 [Temnothorax curvispinosus]
MAVRVCARVIMQLVIVVSASNFIADASVDHREEWVVRVHGGSQVASLLAAQSGYKHHGPVLGFKDTYIWLKDDNPSQKKRGNIRLTKALNANSKIIWADQQKTVKRLKRDYVSLADLESEKPLTREKRVQLNIYGDASNAINSENHVADVRKRIFNDELWDQEWYLQDTRTNKALPKLDLNVLPLYRLGITGRGVKIAVLDDGLEYTHDDLRNNYDAAISYDINEGDDDPFPRYDVSGMNGHGTRCAGEIAMEANNQKCGVGVAFEASVGGIKLLDGLVNDRVEGEALGFKSGLIDIYTASWGPADDGKSLEAPGRLAVEALERGVTEGRKGKGNIYVWASGNGGSKSDDCGCDGYVGSIYTVAVGSASQTGRFPWYGERCPATLATTYSSGAYHDQMIATTDLRNTCTTRHTGTSASAPLAAGILALALQVNEDLTWRDIQHLIAWSSEYSPLRENPGWFKNAAGFWFNSRFGFGLMNAYALVTTSYNWTTVPEKTICKVDNAYIADTRLIYGNSKKLQFNAGNVCRTSGNEIISLEHVEVETNLKYSRRGALQMYLTAPSGTLVRILSPRKLDNSDAGFTKWKFMSVATWGEDPRGTWTLDILDEIGPERNNGTIGAFTLILHGTVQIPLYRRNGPRIYNEDYNRIRKTYDMMESNSVNSEDEYDRNISSPEINTILYKQWLKKLLLKKL